MATAEDFTATAVKATGTDAAGKGTATGVARTALGRAAITAADVFGETPIGGCAPGTASEKEALPPAAFKAATG